MKWTAQQFTVRGELIRSKCAIQSEEGYVVSRYMPEGAEVYIARCPAGRIIFSGVDAEKAKQACESHLIVTELRSGTELAAGCFSEQEGAA